jgi:NAD(P)-dependent dehydrogenase (short-subunit alcohol dehydrogenase family)
MAKAVVPYLLQVSSGRIINISVSDGTMKRKGMIPYGPSRAGTESLSHIMAQDLAGHGVTVNMLLPGGGTEEFRVDPEQWRVKFRVQLLRPDVMAEPTLYLVLRRIKECPR